MSFAFDRNPVTYINLAKAIITLAIVLGFPVTDGQQNAIVNVVGLLATFIIGGWAQQKLVTPVAAPKLPQGTEVQVVTPPGQDDKVVTL